MQTFTFVVAVVFCSLVALTVLKYAFLLFVVAVNDGRRSKKYKNSKRNGEEQSPGAEQTATSALKRNIINFLSGCYKYLCFKVSRLPSNKLRVFLYRHVFHVKIGKKVIVHYGLELREGFKITIGDGSIIGDNCILDGRGTLTIGKNVNLSSEVRIFTGQHDHNDKNFAFVSKPVVVGDRAWLSANTVVLPGVNVGEGAVLAAGAVATKELAPYGLYGGVPAKKIADRTDELEYSFDGQTDYFY